MFDDLKLPVEFHKENIHKEDGKEILKDGDNWYLTAGSLVLATITYQKFVKFSMYTISFNEFRIGNKATPYPRKLKYKNTLEEAKEVIRPHLTNNGKRKLC